MFTHGRAYPLKAEHIPGFERTNENRTPLGSRPERRASLAYRSDGEVESPVRAPPGLT